MEMEQFYITLSSKDTNFQSELTQIYNLSDNWYVGLSEISIAKNKANIPSWQEISLVLYNNQAKDNQEIFSGAINEIIAGDYEIKELQSKINAIIKRLCESYNSLNHDKIRTYPKLNIEESIFVPGIDDTDHKVFLKFDTYLKEVIGMNNIDKMIVELFNHYFMGDWLEWNIEEKEKPFNEIHGDGCNLNQPCLNNIELHCDCSRFNYIDGEVQSILRFFDIPACNKINFRKIFNPINYFPINDPSFDKISISLMKNKKELIFGDGEIYVILHFINLEHKPFFTVESDIE